MRIRTVRNGDEDTRHSSDNGVAAVTRQEHALTEAEAARYIGMSAAWLKKSRTQRFRNVTTHRHSCAEPDEASRVSAGGPRRVARATSGASRSGARRIAGRLPTQRARTRPKPGRSSLICGSSSGGIIRRASMRLRRRFATGEETNLCSQVPRASGEYVQSALRSQRTALPLELWSAHATASRSIESDEVV